MAVEELVMFELEVELVLELELEVELERGQVDEH